MEAATQTFATITLQNYFRMYHKLAGMTGTAETEAGEFWDIYKLDVVTIPTNRPVARIDMNDRVYKTKKEKYNAVIDEIQKMVEAGRPVLVGTTSVEISELLSRMLQLRRIPHNVLNAKLHQKEAEIVARAGQKAVVTIATNMAGRGTDIKLTPEVKAAGGLAIIGTERHESRRVDRQLRGRAGRQGDPGESRFYIALTDDVMRLFGSERMSNMMESLGVDEDTPLDHKMLSNAIEQAQKTVESRNFQTRKSVLEYDDVMNQQRNIIYDERRKVLDGEDLRENINKMIYEFISGSVNDALHGGAAENAEHLAEVVAPFEKLFLPRGAVKMEDFKGAPKAQEIIDRVYDIAQQVYDKREAEFGLAPDGQPVMREIERVIMLRVVDEYWMDHIDAMAELKRGIGLRGYGNVKPIDAYKREGYDMFEAMINGIREETVRRIYTIRVRKEQTLERKAVAKNVAANVGGEAPKKKPIKKAPKPGRNDPCPCGKMKADGSRRLKYKECCGRNN